MTPGSEHIAGAFEQLLQAVAEQAAEAAVRKALQHRPPAADDRGAPDYIEPGPSSPRQFFTAAELATRWGWGKTKVYELTEEELPAWRHGQQVRYFWAYVWAFEGRLTRDEADEIYTRHAVQTSKLTVLAHPAQAAGLR